MDELTLGSWIKRRAAMGPEKKALFFGERTWTYAELSNDIDAVAAGLRDLGVRPGDRVAYLGLNHPALLQTFFATALLGAIFVPVNHRLVEDEIAFILGDSGAGVVVYGPEMAEVVGRLKAQGRGRVHVPLARSSSGPSIESFLDRHRAPDVLPFTKPAAAHPRGRSSQAGPDDVCQLIYTSGTTGRPKGVMLTHSNLSWNVLNFQSAVDFRSDDVTLAMAPLYRAGGWGITLLPTLFKGGAVVLMPQFDAPTALDLLRRHAVRTLFASPQMLAHLSAQPGWNAALDQLRWVISGGDTVPEPMVRRFLDQGVNLLPGYGLSEASPLALIMTLADLVRRPDGAGRPPLFTRVRIAREDGSPASPGEIGEIVVKGPNVMKGYWKRPEETAATIVDGWLHTGDAGVMDETGCFTVVDRFKNMYVNDGENVFPAEVERVLREHEAVAEAAVVAVPLEPLRSAGVAFVVLNEGADVSDRDLLAFCRERLAGYKVPARIEFRRDLPRNPAGKILRQRLAS